MSHLGPVTPAVEPEIDDAGFWSAAAERRLVIQRCGACGTLRHPPRPVCAACGSSEHDWAEAPTEGAIFSYTVTHVAAPGVDKAHVPFNVALVAFADLPDIRLITNIVDAAPEEVSIGAPVALVWDADRHDRPLPRFALKKDQS